MTKRLGFPCLGLLLAGILVAGCGSSSSSSASAGSTSTSSSSGSTSAGKPFTALFIGDLSGPLKSLGGTDLLGLKASAAYWNAHGGILGHKIVVTSIDDAGTAPRAVSGLLKYLSSNPKPDFVYAGVESAETAALIPELAKEGILGFAGTDGSEECLKTSQTTCPTFFAINPPVGLAQSAVAAYAKRKGYTHVGILQEEDPYAQGETPALVAALTKVGIKSSTASFPATALDVTPEMSALKSDGVDMVYPEVLSAAIGYTAGAKAKLSWNVPLVFDPGAGSFDIPSLAPASALKGAMEVVYRPVDGALSLPGLSLLESNAKPLGGLPSALPADAPAILWDSLVLVHNAAAQAHSIKATAIAQALQSLPSAAQNDPLYLMSKTFTFTAADHESPGGTPSDFPLIPVGPLSGGQLHPKAG